MRYFDHDTSAADDDRIMALRLLRGGAAVDAYWTILETIYRDEEPFDATHEAPAYRTLSHRLAVASETLGEYVSAIVEVGLLYVEECDDGTVLLHSARAEGAIETYLQRCETARQNGKKGGEKSRRKAKGKRTVSNRLASGKQSVSDSQANKNKKVLGTYSGTQIPDGPAAGGEDAATAPHSDCPETVEFPCVYCHAETVGTWCRSIGKYSVKCAGCGGDYVMSPGAVALATEGAAS